MIKNILVALDGSEHGTVATSTAIDLAKRLDGHVNGLHVMDLWLVRGSFLHDVNGMLGIEPQLHMTDTVESFLSSKAATVVEAFHSRCRQAGVAASAEIVTDLVHQAISTEATRNDLIVIGARGASLDGGQGLVGRHLPKQLLGDLPVPMLVTTRSQSALSHGVVAFDGSPGSYRALAMGAQLAARGQMGLSVLWVDSGGLEYEEQDALERAKRYLGPYKIDAAYHSRKGIAVEELTGWVQELGADLLLTGSHGPSRLREFLLGHLPGQLIEKGLGVPLLVCP